MAIFLVTTLAVVVSSVHYLVALSQALVLLVGPAELSYIRGKLLLLHA